MSEMHINEALVEKQGLCPAEVKEIESLHEIRETLFENIADLNPEVPDELEMIRHAALELQDLEFALQEAWRFQRNADFHSWWFRMPHCTCPKLDNMDMIGSKYKYYNMACPVHNPTPYPTKDEGNDS